MPKLHLDRRQGAYQHEAAEGRYGAGRPTSIWKVKPLGF